MNRQITQTLCLSAAVAFWLLTGCSREEAPPPPAGAARGEAAVLLVSIAPQEYLVRRLAGPAARVEILVPPGQSPETYEVTPRQMQALATARVFFRIGVPAEDALLPRIQRNHPGLKVVDTREGIALLDMEEAASRAASEAAGQQAAAATEHGAHDPDPGHGEEAEEEPSHQHHHEGKDPHIWLDPAALQTQARLMARELKALDPARAAEIDAALAALLAELESLDARLAERLRPFAGRSFYVFHPAYGYFAHRYGLRQRAIEREGKSPGARYVDALIEDMRREGVRVIFTQPQFSTRAAPAMAAATGAALAAAAPSGGRCSWRSCAAFIGKAPARWRRDRNSARSFRPFLPDSPADRGRAGRECRVRRQWRRPLPGRRGWRTAAG